MHVLVDMITAGSGFGRASGGMVVYYEGLLSAMVDDDRVAAVTVLVSPWNDGLALPNSAKLRVYTCARLPRARLGRVAYEQLVVPRIVRRIGADALLMTCNVVPLRSKIPTVVVLQSLQWALFPESFARLRRLYLRWMVPASVSRAQSTICVSHWEREEALRLMPRVRPERLKVVYHGVSRMVTTARKADPAPHTRQVSEPYVVMVSALYGFKNHKRLISAFAEMARALDSPHRLLIAGGDADVTADELRAYCVREGIADRVDLLGPVPHEDVAALLAEADAVAYVSLYETFGHPVLEAMAFGRPLVTSAGGATEEIAGGAARLVEPTCVADIARGLREVLTNESMRTTLARAGVLRTQDFSWERCAAETLDVIAEAKGAGRPV